MGVKNPYGITVREDKKAIPFSRGILASSVAEIGFETFEAYKIADRVLKRLQKQSIREVDSSHIRGLVSNQVCICGNVVDRGLPHEYELARTYLKRIEPPALVVPGYNDLQHTGKFLFPEMVGEAESEVDRGAMHFIGINTALPDTETGVIGRGKLSSILSNRLERDKVNVAVQHHKLTPAPGIREHGYIEDAGSSLKKFIESDTDIVLSGHRHVAFSFVVDGLITVNSGTVSSRNHYTLFGNSFNLLTFFRNGGLLVEEYRLSEGRMFTLARYRLQRWPALPP
jgi:3',5'-cyclic AMP phosphodiesterase CpdA